MNPSRSLSLACLFVALAGEALQEAQAAQRRALDLDRWQQQAEARAGFR
jgi:hypothetical protein